MCDPTLRAPPEDRFKCSTSTSGSVVSKSFRVASVKRLQLSQKYLFWPVSRSGTSHNCDSECEIDRDDMDSTVKVRSTKDSTRLDTPSQLQHRVSYANDPCRAPVAPLSRCRLLLHAPEDARFSTAWRLSSKQCINSWASCWRVLSNISLAAPKAPCTFVGRTLGRNPPGPSRWAFSVRSMSPKRSCSVLRRLSRLRTTTAPSSAGPASPTASTPLTSPTGAIGAATAVSDTSAAPASMLLSSPSRKRSH
mmetsp:Transcript_7647/g.22610  ORF Transcript_7647/g.22610 Transcript_7647/m.22610 type:complete len:250 (+) Transcript_7647:237-986(+)